MFGKNMNSKRYEPPTVDLKNRNSSHTLIVELTGCNKTVLEVGTSTGYLSKILKEQGNRVIGVEIDAEAAAIATQYCDQVITEDVETFAIENYFEPDYFDVVIFGDVLEHLRWPHLVLEKVKRHLKPNGYLVVSIPNIAHGDIILNLLAEKFRYTEMGLLDITHFRFFALDDIIKLFEDGGYQITDLQTTTIEVGATEANINLGLMPIEVLGMIKTLPHAQTYQFVFRAYLKEYGYVNPISLPKADLTEAFRQFKETHISYLEGVVREKDGEIGNLKEAIDQKATQISRLEDMVSKKETEVAGLSASLLEKDGEIGNLKETMNRKAAQISHLEGVVREREDEAERLKAGLAEKDGEIGDLKETIDQKATQISRLGGMVSKKETEAAGLRASLLEKDGQIRNLQEAINWKSTQMSHLESVGWEKEAKLNHIYNSHGWKALLVYYRARDKILPINTKRRLFVKVIFKMLTNPRGILRNLNKRNLKKFGYYFWTAEPVVIEEKIEKKISATSVGGESNAVSEPPAIKMEFEENINEGRIEDLYFPYYDQPLVSIIIPVWNKWQYTFKCLDSILKNTKEVLYEVIVVDNGSSDETGLMLKKVKNIKIIDNSANIGFVEACNIGANVSNGKYILILNNDTQVSEGWLISMVELAEKDKSIGLVGAKLIYPDGKLQEAGGIVWNDPVNLAWNYGRYDNPNKWEYNYVKEVDYCSAACLLVKKDLFERIGLFDKRFTPGYCEDVDLAFSIRKLGYKVMYQPKSEVVHFEGTTAGVNISEGYKSYQVINQRKFYEKWKDTLEIEHFQNGQNVFFARDRSQKKQVILVVDHYVPTYDKDAGSLRMFNILKILSELGHKVTFIGDNLLRLEPYTQELQQEGVEVIYAPYILSVKDYIHEFGRYFSVVILSRSHIAIKHIDMVKSSCAKARIIYDTVDLAFLRESRRAKIENNKNLLEEAEKLKSKDLYLSRNSDLTLVVSQVEKSLLLKENPLLNVGIVSIIQRIAKPQKSFSERKGILFVGGFDHLPNIDAVIFFVKEIFPVIEQRLPDLTFCIAGSNPPDQVLALKSSHVIVTGYVKDLTSYFESSKVFVAPLRYGAGVKGKINHSMSHGLPVVTTSIGAEGIELTGGSDILIADEPEEFAETVVRLYTDENLWNKLSENSIKNIEKHFSYEVAKHKLKGLLEGNRNKCVGNHV